MTALALLLLLCSFIVSVPEVEVESRTVVVPADYDSVQEAVDNVADGDVILSSV